MTEDYKKDLFLNRRFEANSFQIGKVRLKSPVTDLDLTEIVEVFVNHNGYENLNFSKRIELLKTKSGWVHYAAGASFEIDKGFVRQIKLSTKYLQNSKTHKEDLVRIFGQPDSILVDDICYTALDYNIDAYILVYRQKQFYASIDPKSEILKELHFGTIDEKKYAQKSESVSKSSYPKTGRTLWQKLLGSE